MVRRPQFGYITKLMEETVRLADAINSILMDKWDSSYQALMTKSLQEIFLGPNQAQLQQFGYLQILCMEALILVISHHESSSQFLK